jgi:hypothetical protein
MKAIVNKMIKEILTDGLKKGKGIPSLVNLSYPTGGFFTSNDEKRSAFTYAMGILELLKMRASENMKQSSPQHLDYEQIIDKEIAKMSIQDSLTRINSRFADRSNNELIKEVKDGIAVIRRLGDEDGLASFYERELKRRTGEE